MSPSSHRNFGLLIGIVLPGFTWLLGMATVIEPLRFWLIGTCGTTLAVGGVVYVTAASVIAGMVLNLVRWALLDSLFVLSGIQRPHLNFALLTAHLAAFDRMVDDHFRFYQFYACTLLALVLGFAAWRISPMASGIVSPWTELALVSLSILLVAASRDALRKYYDRTSILLIHLQEMNMTNGNHPKPQPSKPEPKDDKDKSGRKKPAKPTVQKN